MPLTSYLGLAAVGLSAGVLSGFFGIGGGVLIVPALVFFFGYAQHSATGTSLVALLLPVGFLAVMQYYRSGKIGPVEIRAGLLIAAGLFIGALLGSKIALQLPAATLRKGFAVFLTLMAAKFWLQK